MEYHSAMCISTVKINILISPADDNKQMCQMFWPPCGGLSQWQVAFRCKKQWLGGLGSGWATDWHRSCHWLEQCLCCCIIITTLTGASAAPCSPGTSDSGPLSQAYNCLTYHGQWTCNGVLFSDLMVCLLSLFPVCYFFLFIFLYYLFTPFLHLYVTHYWRRPLYYGDQNVWYIRWLSSAGDMNLRTCSSYADLYKLCTCCVYS